jgi:hypothetical protein
MRRAHYVLMRAAANAAQFISPQPRDARSYGVVAEFVAKEKPEGFIARA